MRRIVLLAALLTVALFQIGDSKAPPRVEFLKPIPRWVSDRDLIPYKVRVEAHSENRLLRFVAVDRLDGAEVSLSEEQLAGERAPRTRTLWRRMPAGDLWLVAEVWDSQKPLGRAQIPLCVIAMAGELCPSLTVEP